jgi:hypothetical protein
MLGARWRCAERFSRSLRPKRYWTMLTADLEDFTGSHGDHGRLIADTGTLTPTGYRLTVPCPCGVTRKLLRPEPGALASEVA